MNLDDEARSCRKPSNGGGCVRDDDFDDLRREQATTTTLLHRFQERCTNEFLNIFGAISRVETKVDRLLEGLVLGNVQVADESGIHRGVLQSLDYEEGDVTGVQERPEIIGRMRVAERKADSLEEQLAAALARLSERDRQSARAIVRLQEAELNSIKKNELAVAKWKITAGILLAIVAAVAAIAQAVIR